MKTPGSGRRAGTPNKATALMRELAQPYGPSCIAFWVTTLNDPQAEWEHRNESAKQLRDTGYGKPSRVLDVQGQQDVRVGDGTWVEWLADDRFDLLMQLMAEGKAAMEAGAPQPAQIAASKVMEAEEIVDGGVVIRDAEPLG